MMRSDGITTPARADSFGPEAAVGLEELPERLEEVGYAVVSDVIDVGGVLDPLLDELASTLALAARARRSGPGERTFASCTLSEALIALVGAGASWVGQVLDISLPQGGIRPDTPILLAPEVFALLSAPSLLDVLARVLGEEIWLSPVAHTRLKVPGSIAPSSSGLLGHVPWHQDNGVLLEEADDVDILTVWIPLTDATPDNGCLQVLPSRRDARLLEHCNASGGLSIPPTRMPELVARPVPMRRGDVLLMHSRTVHSSMHNMTTDQVRISMDLRYQRVGSPTGRPAFPSLPLRRAAGDARPAASHRDWAEMWLRARAELADRQLGRFNRWDPDAPLCA